MLEPHPEPGKVFWELDAGVHDHNHGERVEGKATIETFLKNENKNKKKTILG